MMPSATKKVTVTRRSEGHYLATNARGGQIRFGTGSEDEFSPVELLLAAIGGCSSVDVDTVTSRRADPDQFEVTVSGQKVVDENDASRLDPVGLDFAVHFPDTDEGREAAGLVERLVKLSRDKNCTVSRTIESATPVLFKVDGQPLD
jgi:putative redox protein